MQARTRWWLIAVIALVIIAALGVLEPIKFRDRIDPNTGDAIEPIRQIGPVRVYRPRLGITLGLDLRGGSHLVLQVQEEAVFEFTIPQLEKPLSEEQQTELRAQIIGLLPKEEIGTSKREVELREQRVVVRTHIEDKRDVAHQARIIEDLLAEQFPEVTMKRGEAEEVTGDNLVAIERIIENRVNAYGLTEPVIQRQPRERRIVVELPGVKDPEQAKELISRTAVLEFRHIPKKYAFGERAPHRDSVADREVLTFYDPTGDEVPTSQVVEESPVIVTGRNLVPNSRVDSVAGRGTVVTFEFQGEGRKKFEDFTRGHINHYLGIVLDGELISCPVIEETIPGEGVIRGGFDVPGGLERANELSILLNAGALPFDLKYIEERTVSAQLGQDALIKSLWAGLIGLGLVLIFMALYYRLPGILADLALIIYCILLLGAIRLVNQVLTLPGILAVILSIGMAVDANIIIFERLKEEIRTGKTMRSAVEAAFKRAWAAILDSNVCSIGTGVVLFYFGTGPIKGFAVALIIGVAVSLFTAVTVTRLFMNLVINSRLARNVALFGVSPGEVEGA